MQLICSCFGNCCAPNTDKKSLYQPRKNSADDAHTSLLQSREHSVYASFTVKSELVSIKKICCFFDTKINCLSLQCRKIEPSYLHKKVIFHDSKVNLHELDVKNMSDQILVMNRCSHDFFDTGYRLIKHGIKEKINLFPTEFFTQSMHEKPETGINKKSALEAKKQDNKIIKSLQLREEKNKQIEEKSKKLVVSTSTFLETARKISAQRQTENRDKYKTVTAAVLPAEKTVSFVACSCFLYGNKESNLVVAPGVAHLLGQDVCTMESLIFKPNKKTTIVNIDQYHLNLMTKNGERAENADATNIKDIVKKLSLAATVLITSLPDLDGILYNELIYWIRYPQAYKKCFKVNVGAFGRVDLLK